MNDYNSMNLGFQSEGRQKRVLHYNFYVALFLKCLLVTSPWGISRGCSYETSFTPTFLACFFSNLLCDLTLFFKELQISLLQLCEAIQLSQVKSAKLLGLVNESDPRQTHQQEWASSILLRGQLS